MLKSLLLDKERVFKYRMCDMEKIEARFKKNIESAVESLETAFMGDRVFFIWSGLVHEDKELTIEKLKDAIDSSETTFADALTQAIAAWAYDFSGKSVDTNNQSSGLSNGQEEKNV